MALEEGPEAPKAGKIRRKLADARTAASQPWIRRLMEDIRLSFRPIFFLPDMESILLRAPRGGVYEVGTGTLVITAPSACSQLPT